VRVILAIHFEQLVVIVIVRRRRRFRQRRGFQYVVSLRVRSRSLLLGLVRAEGSFRKRSKSTKSQNMFYSYFRFALNRRERGVVQLVMSVLRRFVDAPRRYSNAPSRLLWPFGGSLGITKVVLKIQAKRVRIQGPFLPLESSLELFWGEMIK